MKVSAVAHVSKPAAAAAVGGQVTKGEFSKVVLGFDNFRVVGVVLGA